MSILQTNFESDFVVNATAAERPTVNSMNYRGLNNITRKNQYPLPLIKETLNGISKVRYFTKLDITAAFHKIRIIKE